ncbi:kinase-like protein [Rickenella mellea]|uniref:Kinase-like protein n=1 Tax=Rickenella mellea TaxID=50990 RepID=A0A4Y7Q4K6_9AGAM|nr:kinase-like protein [Rickenella mellea]
MPAPPYLAFKRSAQSQTREEKRRNDERERQLQQQLQEQRQYECIGSITYSLKQSKLRRYGEHDFYEHPQARMPLGDGRKSLVYRAALARYPAMLDCVVKVRSRGVENEAIRNDIACARLKLYFRREAKIWAKLGKANHPNILPILGYVARFESSIFPGLISPFYAKGNMYDYIHNWPDRQNGLWCPESVKLQLLCDLLNGLIYVHSKFIVHRDLKATNVLIDDNGVALLGDFGNSKFLVSVGEIPSSDPAPDDWTPPEYIRHDQVGYHSPTTEGDMWSFGCTFIEIIREQNPCYPERYPKNKIVSGHLPSQDRGDGHLMNDRYWSVISACFNKGGSPTGRISAQTALRLLQMLLSIRTLSDKAKELRVINPLAGGQFKTASDSLKLELYHAVAMERTQANAQKQKFVANLKRIGQSIFGY